MSDHKKFRDVKHMINKIDVVRSTLLPVGRGRQIAHGPIILFVSPDLL